MTKSHIACVLLSMASILLTSCNQNGFRPRTGFYTAHRKSESKSESSIYKARGISRSNKEITSPAEYNTPLYTTAPNKKTLIYPNMGLRQKIILEAQSYTGVDYKYGGKTPEEGFDCSGFTAYIFKNHGIDIKGPSHVQAKRGIKTDIDNLGPADLIFFGDKDQITHVGIVTYQDDERLEVVHSTTSEGVKIDNIKGSDYWTKKALYGVSVIE